MTDHTVDARRLLCPMPVIRAQDSIKNLSKGDMVNVICTDPGAQQDIPAWCRINGHKVANIRNEDGCIIIVIEVEGAEA